MTLAEKVNLRMDLSGKEKTELVVKSLVEFLGEGNPELVALVEGVIPGMLELVVSTARGVFNLRPARSSCFPTNAPTAPAPSAEPRAAEPTAPEPTAAEERKVEAVPWSFFCVPFAKALPKVTLREPV